MRRVGVGFFILFFAQGSIAQQFAGEDKWKFLFEHECLRFLYLFYPRADSINDGVVMMLQNQNGYGINYRFTIIFESTAEAKIFDVEGSMKPLEIKTGDADGLFWIPFEDGRSIGGIRMRKYRVTRKIRTRKIRDSV